MIEMMRSMPIVEIGTKKNKKFRRGNTVAKMIIAGVKKTGIKMSWRAEEDTKVLNNNVLLLIPGAIFKHKMFVKTLSKFLVSNIGRNAK